MPDGIPKLLVASGNAGKVREFQALAEAAGSEAQIELLPGFAAIPEFPEDAPTFAENAAGKAIYYSRDAEGLVISDDSGLVVPALGGAPGVLSARYAGPAATSAQRMEKLLFEMRGFSGRQRAAYFVCVIAAARRGCVVAVVSAKVDGMILDAPQGTGGFGYDPVFLYPPLEKTFAELAPMEKNDSSHRGRAFRRLLAALKEMQ